MEKLFLGNKGIHNCDSLQNSGVVAVDSDDGEFQSASVK